MAAVSACTYDFVLSKVVQDVRSRVLHDHDRQQLNAPSGRRGALALHAARQQRLEQDPQVQPGRPVVDVIEVVIDARAHLVVGVGLAAQAVDLRPAGDARQHVMPPRIERDLLLVLPIVRERMRARAKPATCRAPWNRSPLEGNARAPPQRRFFVRNKRPKRPTVGLP